MASRAQSFTANPSWTEPQKLLFQRAQTALPIALGYFGPDIPNLSNHPVEQIIDETGYLKAGKKLMETAEKAHVERLKIKLSSLTKADGSPIDTKMGRHFVATFKGGGRVILNQGACKELLEKFDAVGVSLDRLASAIASGQIQVPDNVRLAQDMQPGKSETNSKLYHTSSAGGRSLFVDPIA